MKLFRYRKPSLRTLTGYTDRSISHNQKSERDQYISTVHQTFTNKTTDKTKGWNLFTNNDSNPTDCKVEFPNIFRIL